MESLMETVSTNDMRDSLLEDENNSRNHSASGQTSFTGLEDKLEPVIPIKEEFDPLLVKKEPISVENIENFSGTTDTEFVDVYPMAMEEIKPESFNKEEGSIFKTQIHPTGTFLEIENKTKNGDAYHSTKGTLYITQPPSKLPDARTDGVCKSCNKYYRMLILHFMKSKCKENQGKEEPRVHQQKADVAENHEPIMIQTTSMPGLLENECRGCLKTCQNLLLHLSKSKKRGEVQCCGKYKDEEIKEHKNAIKRRVNKEFYDKNQEKIKSKHKEYYQGGINKDSIREKQKQYCLNNKESIKEKQKQYFLNNKESIKEKQKQYFLNNKESIKEKQKQYNLNNKETIKEKQKQSYSNNRESILDSKRKSRNDTISQDTDSEKWKKSLLSNYD